MKKSLLTFSLITLANLIQASEKEYPLGFKATSRAGDNYEIQEQRSEPVFMYFTHEDKQYYIIAKMDRMAINKRGKNKASANIGARLGECQPIGVMLTFAGSAISRSLVSKEYNTEQGKAYPACIAELNENNEVIQLYAPEISWANHRPDVTLAEVKSSALIDLRLKRKSFEDLNDEDLVTVVRHGDQINLIKQSKSMGRMYKPEITALPAIAFKTADGIVGAQEEELIPSPNVNIFVSRIIDTSVQINGGRELQVDEVKAEALGEFTVVETQTVGSSRAPRIEELDEDNLQSRTHQKIKNIKRSNNDSAKYLATAAVITGLAATAKLCYDVCSAESLKTAEEQNQHQKKKAILAATATIGTVGLAYLLMRK